APDKAPLKTYAEDLHYLSLAKCEENTGRVARGASAARNILLECLVVPICEAWNFGSWERHVALTQNNIEAEAPTSRGRPA
ncbi:MAG: hypothetical protein LC623_09255, partial [Halobacteriales archaeon]|nr:hypothetical protein [Halobacteriales archaeon]